MIGQDEASLGYVRFVTHIESAWGYAKWSEPHAPSQVSSESLRPQSAVKFTVFVSDVWNQQLFVPHVITLPFRLRPSQLPDCSVPVDAGIAVSCSAIAGHLCSSLEQRCTPLSLHHCADRSELLVSTWPESLTAVSCFLKGKGNLRQ